MGKTINTILNLTDKFTPKLTAAGKQTLIFKQQLKNCNSAADKIDSGLSKLAKTAVAVGEAGAAAMGAFAVSSLNTYKDFQQSMSDVAGILSVDTGSETYKKLETAAREAGKTTTKTAQESADALSYMALAGWSVEDSVNGLMPILRASEATGADLATTSDLVTDSMSALGLQTNELNHYLDVCARAQNKSNTTLTQMQEAYIGCGGTFKTFNTPLDESGALLGILANRGIKGEAGTKLQSTLVNLTKQSGESAKAMAAIGISAYDSEGKFKGITNVLKEVQEKTKNLTEEERNNYLTMIAGKTQLTTLNALMAGLSNTLADGTNEYEALRGELQNCNGSLDRMADTMTNNLSGAIARAQSATDDLKISLGQKLEPYVTQFFNWFAEKLPSATEKFGVWLDNKIPKAINFCKAAFDKIKPVVSFTIRSFSELAIAGGTVVVGLKAFSIMVKISSFANKLKGTMTGLTTAQKLATICQIAFNTSLLACPLTWIAAGIAAVGAGVLIWKKHLEKADIAKHFGDITLSAEECQEIVKGVFGSDILGKVDDVKYGFEQLEESLQRTTDSANALKKLNFKISLGDNSISQEDYLSAVDEYVKNLQEAVADKQYSLQLNIDLLFDNSEFGSVFSADAKGYYGQLSEQASKLGEDLKAAAKNAYEHGWDLDSTEAVAAIMKQQAEIQEKISAAQSEAKLETLKYDFSTGDLSQESFQNLIDATNEELENLKSTYQQARIDAIAQAKLMYVDGSEELANAITEANTAYNEKIAGLTAKGLQFENDAIMGAFPEISDAIKGTIHPLLEFDAETNPIGYTEEAFNDLANGSLQLTDGVVTAITQAMEMSFGNVAPETRKHIAEFYESMLPSVNELQAAMQDMNQVPQSYANVFMQSSAIGAVGNNSKALKNLGVTTLSTVLPEDVSKVLQSSKAYGDSFVKGITSNENLEGTQTAADRLRKTLSDTLSKPISITVPVSYNPVTLGSTIASQPRPTPAFVGPMPTIKQNATGTTYFGGGFTTINEHGYEVVDLPQGTRIYPHSESEKMMNGSQNISVSVNVHGSIFGLDNAAELIGGMVCDKIVETVRAV